MHNVESRMPTANTASAVVELRQYSLHPGRRDELIRLFDRYFVESQEQHGMRYGRLRDPFGHVWSLGAPLPTKEEGRIVD